MTKSNFILVCGLVLICLLAGTVLFDQRSNASVVIGGEYKSTTTDSTFTSAGKVLATGNGTLGSVVITLGSNAPLEIYDGTTTSSHADWPTTTLASFKTTATPGTYTFDVIYRKGLIVVSPSTVGVASTTVTFR